MDEKYDWESIRSEYKDLMHSAYEEISPGWFNIVREMLNEVSLLPKEEQFPFTQIKSKFGSLTAYTQEHSESQKNIVIKYERIADRTCEFCGNPGIKQKKGGWITTLCDICYVHTT